MRRRLAAAAALLLVCAARPAGAVELRYILQDLRCLPMSRSLMGDGDCPVEQKSVVIAGSTAMVYYTRLLAEAFEKRNPGIKVEISGGSSIAGLIAVDRGAIDLAAVARDLAPKEYRPELRVTMIGRDGLVVVVNQANPLSDLPKEQVRAIFMGETVKWPNGHPIHVVSRNQGAASLESFEEIVMAGEKITAAAQEAKKAGEMVSAVAADADAVGFVGLHGLTPEVKALTVDGVPVSDATILSSRYPLVRSLNLVEEGEEAGEPKRRFVDFATGPEGQTVIEKAGAVRVD